MRRAALLLLLLPWACSPASGNPEPQSPAHTEPEPPPPDAGEPEHAVSPNKMVPCAEPHEPTPSPGSAPTPTPKPVREVTYRVTQEGLVVEADGVRFKPTATPVRLSNGGHAIQLEVAVEVLDQRTHTL